METMKYKKIAVCISGQIRTALEAFVAHENFFLIERNNIDFFIHTWYQPDLEDHTELIEKIKTLYNPKCFQIDKSENYDRLNFEMMFKSMLYCNELKKNYEFENDFLYDVVVRYRFDIIFPKETHFSIKNFEKRKLYTPNINTGIVNTDYEKFGICDLFFWCDSLSMDIICGAYRYYKYVEKPISEIFFQRKEVINVSDSLNSPGQILYKIAVERNILPVIGKSHNDSQIIYTPFRVECKHLNPLEQWVEIAEFYIKQFN